MRDTNRQKSARTQGSDSDCGKRALLWYTIRHRHKLCSVYRTLGVVPWDCISEYHKEKILTFYDDSRPSFIHDEDDTPTAQEIGYQ
jgi:hypothetical protein